MLYQRAQNNPGPMDGDAATGLWQVGIQEAELGDGSWEWHPIPPTENILCWHHGRQAEFEGLKG